MRPRFDCILYTLLLIGLLSGKAVSAQDVLSQDATPQDMTTQDTAAESQELSVGEDPLASPQGEELTAAPLTVPATSSANPPGTPAAPAAATEVTVEPPAGIVAGEVFVNANAAYEANRFEEAASLYQKIIDNGYESGHLHYNLGNALLRNGELGSAIASYRRSLKLMPRDQDVMANLDFARKSTKDATAPPVPSAVQKTLFFWHYGLSRAELGTLFAGLNGLFWGVLLLRIFRRGSEILRWSTFTLLILVLVTGGSLALRHLRPEQVAVVIPQEIDVRSGTSDNALVLFKLHAGTEVRVVDRREDALRIELSEDNQGGWIEAQHAELVAE